MMAFCSGVKDTSRWPMEVWARAASSGISPMVDFSWGTPSSIELVADAHALGDVAGSAPVSTASSAKAVLHDRANAVRRVVVPPQDWPP